MLIFHTGKSCVPVLCRNNKSFIKRGYSSLERMSSEPEWKLEKLRILNLPIEEKRKLYIAKDYTVWDKVDDWRVYTIKNKHVKSKKPILDDITVFKKITLNKELSKVLCTKVSIFKGDITKLEVDAIANAANSMLKAGGGVDGAIHRAAGPLLQQECYSLGGCPTGQAKITGGYNLPAKYVIHTVGPQDCSEKMLQSCYENSLAYQNEYKLKTIAFPCISTGVYGFPNRLAAHIALRTVRKYLELIEGNKDVTEVERIYFCTFLPEDIEIYETLIEMYFPTQEWNYNEGASLTED